MKIKIIHRFNPKFKTLFLIMITLLTLGFYSETNAAVIYVNATSPAGNNGDGSSWVRAYNNLDSALAKASTGANQIWVAQGIYKPTIPYGGAYENCQQVVCAPNLVTFLLPNNVSIYGGFSGNEQTLGQRNPAKFPTILSGDIANANANNMSNAWHVVTADGVSNVLVDGFTITDGYAAGPSSGVFSDVTFNITALNYTEDGGSAMLADNGATVSLNNMNIVNNSENKVNDTFTDPIFAIVGLPSPAVACGGAVASVGNIPNNQNIGTQVNISNSTFQNNNALETGCDGGALNATFNGNITVSSSSFSNNSADRNGGAIHARDAGTIKVNGSTFTNNRVTGSDIGDESGGAIGIFDSNLAVTGSDFQSNLSLSAAAGGGAIVFHPPFDDGTVYTFSVIGSNFNNNQGSSTGGGAINIPTSGPNAGDTAVIKDSVFTNNTGGVGGAIYLDSMPTTISDCQFSGNQAVLEGGAIFASSAGDEAIGADVTSLSQRPVVKINASLFYNNSLNPNLPMAPPALVLNASTSTAPQLLLFSGMQLPPAGVTSMDSGGGAVASEFGGNVQMSNCKLKNNSAIGDGGALLIGGSTGFGGTSPLDMNQAYLNISNSVCSGNTATNGTNNYALIDAANIGIFPNGVDFVTDGSCR